MAVDGAGNRIREALGGWAGVTLHPHRFGGTEFRLGRRELGHLHGDYLLDIPFPKRIRDELVSRGEAQPHHILPDTGWVSFYIQSDADIDRAVGLLRRSYEIALRQHGGHAA